MDFIYFYTRLHIAASLIYSIIVNASITTFMYIFYNTVSELFSARSVLF